MLDYDQINAQLAGSPLWERCKAETYAAFLSALGYEPIGPVQAPGPGSGTKTQRAIELYKADTTYNQIAAKIGSTPASVAALLKRARKLGWLTAPKRPIGRKPDPSSASQRAAELMRAGADDLTVMSKTGASAALCSQVRSRVRRGLM